MSSQSDAVKFFIAVLGHSDRFDLLFCLDNAAYDGMKILKKALSLVADENSNLKKYVIPFLELLGADELSKGSVKVEANS